MPSSNVSVFINISDKEIKKGVDDKEEKKNKWQVSNYGMYRCDKINN